MTACRLLWNRLEAAAGRDSRPEPGCTACALAGAMCSIGRGTQERSAFGLTTTAPRGHETRPTVGLSASSSTTWLRSALVEALVSSRRVGALMCCCWLKSLGRQQSSNRAPLKFQFITRLDDRMQADDARGSRSLPQYPPCHAGTTWYGLEAQEQESCRITRSKRSSSSGTTVSCAHPSLSWILASEFSDRANVPCSAMFSVSLEPSWSSHRSNP